MSRCEQGEPKKTGVWVQKQVNTIFNINKKANRQKTKQYTLKWDTPNGNTVLVSRAQKPNVLGNRNTVRHIHAHVHRQSNQTGWSVRTEYKASYNGEQLRMCSVTGVCNEGKMSPGGREMVNSGGEREERWPGLLRA